MDYKSNQPIFKIFRCGAAICMMAPLVDFEAGPVSFVLPDVTFGKVKPVSNKPLTITWLKCNQYLDHCRWQREPGPRGQHPRKSSPRQSECDANLTAGRTRKELPQNHQNGVTTFAKPAPAANEFLSKVAQMCDRSTKGSPSKSEENHKN